MQSGQASTTFYFKVGQKLFQNEAKIKISNWGKVYFKIGQLFRSGVKNISKWCSYFRVASSNISKWDIIIPPFDLLCKSVCFRNISRNFPVVLYEIDYLKLKPELKAKYQML